MKERALPSSSFLSRAQRDYSFRTIRLGRRIRVAISTESAIKVMHGADLPQVHEFSSPFPNSPSSSSNMSSDCVDDKRKMPGDDAEHTDHRKRRRNRTTQSCLNCHGSKRMCDRKRPACGRCVKLGLSGTCVYEIDDLTRGDSSQDEVILLKGRIAELEGFIREYKRKPHPRAYTRCKPKRQRRPTSFAPSSPSSEDGTDAGPCGASPMSPESSRKDNLPTSDNSSESDNAPGTPDGDEQIFLTSPSDTTAVLSGAEPSVPSAVETNLPSGSEAAETSTTMDVDPSFAFSDGGGFFYDDSDILDCVVSQTIQQGAQHSVPASDNCHCAKHQATTTFIISELGSHVRRAIDMLQSAPEHQFGASPCRILQQLQSLNESIASKIESPSQSDTPPTFIDFPQDLHSMSTAQVSPPTASPEASPLQLVLAARKAAQAASASASIMPTTFARPAPTASKSTIQTPWDVGSATSNADLTLPDRDPLMSWEPSSRNAWSQRSLCKPSFL